MKQYTSELKQSFLFQASLGSKELFHSNLIAWILEQKNPNGEPRALFKFFERFTDFNLRLDSVESYAVNRERGNIDLTLKWKQGEKWHVLYIENKIKSLPSLAQLKIYRKKIKKKKSQEGESTINQFILTPLPIDDELNREFNEIGWKNITYADVGIVQFLAQLDKGDFENKDLPLVVETYKSFLENLLAIMFEFKLGNNQLKELSEDRYDYYRSERMKVLKDLRIHDLILKLVHQNIALIIKKELRKNGRTLVRNFGEFKNAGDVCISQGFTRSTGITDAKFCIQPGFYLGLQLQGNTMKYVAEVFDQSLVERNVQFSRNMIESEIWFHETVNDQKLLLSGRGRDKNLIINERTRLNSYGNSFLYLNKDMRKIENLTNGLIASIMVEEVERVLNNLEKFQKLIPTN